MSTRNEKINDNVKKFHTSRGDIRKRRKSTITSYYKSKNENENGFVFGWMFDNINEKGKLKIPCFILTGKMFLFQPLLWLKRVKSKRANNNYLGWTKIERGLFFENPSEKSTFFLFLFSENFKDIFIAVLAIRATTTFDINFILVDCRFQNQLGPEGQAFIIIQLWTFPGKITAFPFSGEKLCRFCENRSVHGVLNILIYYIFRTPWVGDIL